MTFTPPPDGANNYLVWCTSNGDTRDDGKLISTHTRQEAAERYAAVCIDSDPRTTDPVHDGVTDAVVVVETLDGDVSTWRVSGSMQPTYDSKRLS